LQHQRVNALEHRLTLARHMLFDAGAEAEMRTFGVEQDGAEARVFEMLVERAA